MLVQTELSEDLLRASAGSHQIFNETLAQVSVYCVHVHVKDTFGIARLKFA